MPVSAVWGSRGGAVPVRWVTALARSARWNNSVLLRLWPATPHSECIVGDSSTIVQAMPLVVRFAKVHLRIRSRIALKALHLTSRI
jgi:hypothetical protein